MSLSQSAFYLPVKGGECFCVLREPVGRDAEGVLLHLPAFGDEMNKSRAMTARAARALAGAGFAVLQVDLFGCGDSSGDHAGATFARWAENASSALSWLRRRHGDVKVWLWPLRAGALLVPPLLEGWAPQAALLLWQPVLSGAQQLNLLLRQHVAVDMLADAGRRTGMRALRERLRAGETLEIGGYAVSPRLADDLERAAFDVPATHSGRAAWIEVSPSASSSLTPAASEKIEHLRNAGVLVTEKVVPGPSFWKSTEIEFADALVPASVDAVSFS